MEAQATYYIIGQHIITDTEICHGKPTFRGTRIMVSQVLDMVRQGMEWEKIIEQCHQRISKEAIAEAIMFASQAFVDHVNEYALPLEHAMA